ncbi:zinc transporter 5-like isoform X1 [Schistocerca piceifrons]|uniref:zinc transporter 5-like isoform X1 n=1 Tax=Schistocerca piceifrons TaxID=274613 RepID=UPI001F5E5260|nr:zinc transporter 5-like isoform X1 [Schistocerca piceifrons]
MKGIPGRYISETPESRAIYPSSKDSWFISFLVLSKGLGCFGVFLGCDLLKKLSVIPLVCFVKCVAGCCFLYLQKPLHLGHSLSQAQVCRIAQVVLLKVGITILMYYGMTMCGPFRSILILHNYDFAVLTALGALFSGGSAKPAVIRGGVLFLAAMLTLIFLDHDENEQNSGHSHLFSGIGSWLGLADHKLGVVLLSSVLPIRAGAEMLSKRASQDVGGEQRLHALSTLTEGVVLLPWTIVSLFLQESQGVSLTSAVLSVFLISASTLVVPHFADSACIRRFDMPRVARIGSVSSFLWALLGAVLWSKLASSPGDANDSSVTSLSEDHRLSGGGILACILYMFASLSLTSVNKPGAKGSLVGYSSSGLPLYTFTSSALHDKSRSAFIIASSMLRQVLGSNNSRRIFYFLCLNLSFTFVEFLYGIWTNSLGLISDGFHMLFDCSALVMGLLASVMAHWKPTKTFSFGYSRVEDLSGFVNGLFLLVISVLVFSKGVSRLVDPPAINTQRLLAVSVAGLIVNLVGILVFRHGSSHSHDHQHGHKHSHAAGFHSHSHNANMEGVFLHIMADTLGSVGVIVSSLLIQQFGWYIADPICSMFIAVLIFLSIIPLLKHSAYVLLLRSPVKEGDKLLAALQQVTAIDGVQTIRKQHFWQHSSDTNVGTLHIQAAPDASEQNIIQEACSILKETGIHHFCVQVEKEEFFAHMAGLSWQIKDPVPAFGGNKDVLFLVKAV